MTTTTTSSPQFLESLLEQSRQSQSSRSQIISAHLLQLIGICVKNGDAGDRQTAPDSSSRNSLDESVSSQHSPLESFPFKHQLSQTVLSSQIIVNLLFENEQLARELLENHADFIQWTLDMLQDGSYVPPLAHPQEVSVQLLFRNVIVFWKNMVYLVKDQQLSSDFAKYYNSEAFIRALGLLYSNFEGLRSFILALLDGIVENDGIPSNWKKDSQWIKGISHISAKEAPEELLRLVSVLALEKSFVEELKSVWTNVLIDLMRTRIVELDWEQWDLSKEADEVEGAEEFASLILTTVRLLLAKEESDSQNAATVDTLFFTTLLDIINLRKANVMPELPNKALEILCSYMTYSSASNTQLTREYKLIQILKQVFFRDVKNWTAEFSLRARRQVIRIVGFLTLEDALLEELLNDKENQCIVDMIRSTLKDAKDVLLKRNACIALGNLARSDQNCNRLLNEFHIASTICDETLYHLNLTVRIFDTGEAEKVPDVQYLSNCAFVLANLSRCPDEQCRNTLLEQPVMQIIRLMLHPKIAFLIQFYAVETLQHLLPSLRENTSFIEKNSELMHDIAQQLVILLQTEKAQQKVKLRFVIVRCLTQMMTLMEESRDKVLEWKESLTTGIASLQQYQPQNGETLGATFSTQIDALSTHIESLLLSSERKGVEPEK
uniref:Uncharacterized protein n=1 Tax=Percolomonas cosmopolitus TaxID=63605 RepID=A0A7S1PHJ8_9EUKA